jgi:hypothetical protein
MESFVILGFILGNPQVVIKFSVKQGLIQGGMRRFSGSFFKPDDTSGIIARRIGIDQQFFVECCVFATHRTARRRG